mgnify:CR=1 FL=1
MNILSTEIIDNTITEEKQISDHEPVMPSSISVLVEVAYKEKNYFLEFQSTTTSDYNAYSSTLSAYDESAGWSSLRDKFDNEDDFHHFLEEVKQESDAQNIRDEYVENNFNVDDGDFDGVDASSEINRATRKKELSL